jgi:transcriptional regulator with XRE-family HTH domain
LDNYFKYLGKRLKEAREYKRFTQKAFAEMLEIKQQSLSNYENGAQAVPLEILSKLATDFHVDLHWLLIGDGEMIRAEHTFSEDFFEIPLLTKDEVFSFDQYREIPVSKAHSGQYPKYTFITVPARIKEFGTNLRALTVFDSGMSPILNQKDIVVFEATGWGSDGVYIYRYDGELHISNVSFDEGVFRIINNLPQKENLIPYTMIGIIGRVRAVLKEV